MHFYALVADNGAITAIHSSSVRYIEAAARVSDDTHYYDESTQSIEWREEAETQVDVDGLALTLTGVPLGSVVEIEGHRARAESGTVTAEIEAPGEYEIRISGVPRYLDQTLTVEV